MIFSVDNPMAHKLVITNDKGHILGRVYSFDTETRVAVMYETSKDGKVPLDEKGNLKMIRKVLSEEWFLCTREHYNVKFNFFEKYNKDTDFIHEFHQSIKDALKGKAEMNEKETVAVDFAITETIRQIKRQLK